MPVTVETIYTEALALTDASRLALAERLVESVSPDPQVMAEQMAVVRRRLEELDAGSVQPIAGPDGLRRVRETILKRSEA